MKIVAAPSGVNWPNDMHPVPPGEVEKIISIIDTAETERAKRGQNGQNTDDKSVTGPMTDKSSQENKYCSCDNPLWERHIAGDNCARCFKPVTNRSPLRRENL